MLRDYQQRSIDQLYDWFTKNDGNPCLVLPTGAGKSHIVAALCKQAVQNWKGTRILMLTHQKELIEQNSEKMRLHWPNAPMGIYSASVGKKQLGEPITFAGIQSIVKKGHLLGHQDLVVIDECHLVNHNDEGSYRKLLNQLKEINPALRVVGLTATPYRLGHGLITDKPAIFDDLIEPVTINELIFNGYLAPLKSKLTSTQLSVEGVHKRGGEYIESELQKAVDVEEKNIAIVDEVIRLADNRKVWLFFCSGVEHARHIAEALRIRGITAEVVTGETPKAERANILRDFKAGRIQALTNANVLTTGFDAPSIDLIAMLRPTMSPSLYVQMAGRGLRICEGKKDCLVLDFAGVVQQHGPITAVNPSNAGGNGKGEGEAPVKVCDFCFELCHLSAKFCTNCGALFPEPEKKELMLHNDDIMGNESHEMEVSGWRWARHTGKKSGKDMCKVTYYGGLSDSPVHEYLTINHDGYAGKKAMEKLVMMAEMGKAFIAGVRDIDDLCRIMNEALYPKLIEYKKVGKYDEVVERTW